MIEYENLARSNAPFFEEYEKSFGKVLRGGWYVLGEEVSCFEKEFSSYLDVGHCVGVASGLDALTIGLKALELPMKSEVLVPSNCYIACVLAVIHAGLTPVLVEPNSGTYNIDPENLHKKITPKTSAVMLLHLYGKPCDMDPLMEISREHKLKVIEDCAQAHGATYKGKKVGSFGDMAAFSFYPTKNLGALGDAGALCFLEGKYLKIARELRNYGSSKKYFNERIGYNSRLDEVQAAFLRIKLRHLDSINSTKRNLAKVYFNELKGDFITPQVNPLCEDVFHIFNIRHSRRDELKAFLLKNEVKTEVHYPLPPHRQNAMKEVLDFQGDFPISEEIHATTLSLPISTFHTELDVKVVCEALNAFR